MSEHPDDRFTLHLLGPPDLRAPDGRRIGSVLAQPKRLGLLAYLALSPGPVSRGTVVATFWPDMDEARARNALSQALFHLRRALGDEVVESVEGDRLWVSPERLWCDARELLAERSHGDAATAVGSSAELLEGWRADEAPLQAWLEAQRSRIRRHVVRATTTALVEEATPPTDASPQGGVRASRLVLRRRWAAAAVVAFVALVVITGRLVGGSSTEELAVLLPRVTVAPGAIDLDPQVILDEVLAHLPHRDDVRIVPAPSASSVPDFRLQLATIGATDAEAPDWILEVSVRVSSGAVGVVGLLYRTPELDVPGRNSFGVTYEPDDDALLEVPRAVARGVAEMVERALPEG